MRRLLSILLSAVMFFTAVPYQAAAASVKSCENGECIPKLVDRLEDLGTVYRRDCLPGGIKQADIEKYHRENGLTESCWRYITEINHLESQLLNHQTRLEGRLGCEGGNCKSSAPGESINSQLKALTEVERNLSCSAESKRAVRTSCQSDMNCVLAASAFNVGGHIAELILPEKVKPKNCHLGNDSCAIQMAASFLKAAVGYFQSAWDVMKLIGNKAGKSISQFWNKVSGAENHSSTSQLALAKASEDPGFFNMLLSDFPGTMKKIWGAFVGSVKEWLKTSVFCQKWSGAPQFSQCLQPTNSFDCMPCKTMVTGLCAVSGTIVAEIVPAFLTGGMVTAMKFGVQGAGNISKIFRVSQQGVNAFKNTRLGRTAVLNTSKIDDVTRMSQGLHAAKSLVSGSLRILNNYLLSPGRRVLSGSYRFMSGSVKGGGAFLAETTGGKVLVFSGSALQNAAKVILYPIDNPMTTFAYKAGVRTFETAIRLGTPRLGAKTLIASSIIQRNAQLEIVLARLQKARNASRPNPSEVIKLEEELLSHLVKERKDILTSALRNPETELSEILQSLYPELQYGDLAKKLPKQKVLDAEKEIYLEIQRMPDGPAKKEFLEKYLAHVSQGPGRARVLGDAGHPFAPDKKPGMVKTEAQERFNKPVSPEAAVLKASLTSYSEFAQRELLEKGIQTEKRIRQSSEPIVVDVIAMGAGPNNGVAVSILKETNPSLSVLVIEQSETFGVFNQIKGFDINTPEWIGNSGNTFPGSPVQLSDFNITDASFASAEDLGNLTVATYKSADVDMIFNNKVISWEKEPYPGAWPAQYKVQTSGGLTVYTKSGFAGTGFGSPITRLKDPDSIELVSRYKNELKAVNLKSDVNYSLKASSVDDFLATAVDDVSSGREAMARYKGKKVLVIGSGDGGNIGVEATAGLNKHLNPNNADTGVETIWLGQGSTTGTEFLEKSGIRKNLRYSRIAEGIDSGKIKPVNGYLSRVEEFVNEAGEKQFKAYYTTKDGKIVGDPLIVDNLVFATGYQNDPSSLSPIFKSMADNADEKGVAFNPIKGRVDEFTRYKEFKTESEISTQLTINGKAENVYGIGTFAKTAITDDDWKVPTGGFLDITAPRAAATAKMVAQKLSPQKLSREQTKRLLQVSTGERFDFIRRPLRPAGKVPELPNLQVADIHTRIELGKTLRGFSSKPNASFKVIVKKGTKGKYVYQVSGLEKRAADKVAKALSENASLNHGFEGQFNLGRTVLDIEVKTRASGTINVEKILFTPMTKVVPSPIIVPMNISRGVNKIVSPSLKTFQNNKEEKEDK